MTRLLNSALFGKLLNPTHRAFLQTASETAAVGLVGGVKPAQAFAYAPYPTDDELTTVVTSCAHNVGRGIVW